MVQEYNINQYKYKINYVKKRILTLDMLKVLHELIIVYDNK